MWTERTESNRNSFLINPVALARGKSAAPKPSRFKRLTEQPRTILFSATHHNLFAQNQWRFSVAMCSRKPVIPLMIAVLLPRTARYGRFAWTPASPRLFSESYEFHSEIRPDYIAPAHTNQPRGSNSDQYSSRQRRQSQHVYHFRR